jgi:chromosome segregation ATPase
MANEDDSSVSEDFDESLDLQELINHVKNISTRIQRKKENLEEFVSSMKKETSINKTVLKRFQGFEDDFKEGRRAKTELKELQNRLDDRIKEVAGKLQCIENALQYISSKELQIRAVKDEILNSSEDEQQHEELLKFRNEIQSLFSEIKIKFRECKKVKLSLLTKFKPEDLIQSVKSWEKAAEVAREINRKVNDLQNELKSKNDAINRMEEELKQEKENGKEQEQEIFRLADDIKMEDESKTEQVVLINTFRSLLDESEKLVRNLESQNGNLNKIILDERNRVSDLRGKLSDLQEQIEDERRSNREMNLKFEHMKVEFHTATSENEGYKRDLEMIRKELVAMKEIKDDVSKKENRPDRDAISSEESLEELEENLEVKDKLLNEKYFEVEQLKTELEKSSRRVTELENDNSSITEDTRTVKDRLQVKEREVEELTDIMRDTQAALESEKLSKDQYVIKCEMLERKNALLELEFQENDSKDGKDNHEDMEEEIQNLSEMLKEEKHRVAESSSLVEELEEQLKASEELREYEEDIKTRSIENIVYAELENRKLVEIVEELRDRLSEKDSGIEELIAHCAVEELKLREETVVLTNQLNIYKRDCVYKANIIERLRRQVESHKSGLGILDEEEEETETDILVKAAALERQLHEERIKTMKYEEALLTLNKEYEDAEGVIREKDYELSKKSAEDGKRIAELLQELESDKKIILELEEQIENLEEVLSLKEAINKMETDAADTAVLENELKDMKDDYAVKKLRRKDDLISELKQEVESLKNQLNIEQKRLQKQEDLIGDLNDANIQDLMQIEVLKDRVSTLEDENSSQKEYIEELTEKITEGQGLISEMEGVADRERMRVATIEQLLIQDKQAYSKHLDDVKDLKKKVGNYQANVGELRTKVDRINRNMPVAFSPREDTYSGTISHLQGKISAQKSIIKELTVNMNDAEEKDEDLDVELKEQRGKNIEQDEKIDQLLIKSRECEDLVEYMKDELELVRKRYQGLSGSSDNDSIPIEDRRMMSEDIQETIKDEVQANPMFLFPSIDEEKENEGDDEHEEGESGETVYFDDEKEKQDVQAQDDEQESSETKQRELIHHLLIFEKVFEQIFAEEGRRIDVVLEKFRSVIQKNTELVTILQNLRQTLGEARIENERKENEIKEMKKEIETLQEKGKEKKELEDQQRTIEELNKELKDQITRVNQLTETLSVEQLMKSEYEREIEKLKNNIVEERELSEQLREDVERETNARYEFEVKMNEIEEEAYNSASIINVLQKDLETERKCYGIVTERLQNEQQKLEEIENYLKEAKETANNDKELVEELRKNISIEEKHKTDFLNKLERLEKESFEKDEELNNLMNQLGNERNKTEDLFAEIDLEKMTKSKAEAKLQELEEHFNRDELIFDELRRNIDSESAKNREISELFDRERERNSELEERTKELEKQVLMDLELFDELKTTIEQEREHNRELDALLSEKSSAYNNRDKLLGELDDQLAEMRATIKKEQLRNEELNQELNKLTENEDVVKDLQDMLKSQIIHAGELDQKAQKLEETKEEQSQKIQTLETALKKLKEVSDQVTKELEDDLEAWGDLVDGNDELDAGELDYNENIDYNTERNALRLKALLNNELAIKRNLINKADEYKNQLHENDEVISRLNKAIETHRESVQATEEALNAERTQREETEIKLNKTDEYKKQLHNNNEVISQLNKVIETHQESVRAKEEALNAERRQREETENKLNKVENDLQEERKHVDSSKTDLEKAKQLCDDIRKEREKKNIEIEQLSKSIEEKSKEEANKIQNLQSEKENVIKEKKEKEDECELMKTYYEEEHKFAKERIEQNQFLKKQIEELEVAAKEKQDVLDKLQEEKSNLSLMLEETNTNFKKQASVLKELKDKVKNIEDKGENIKELQKEIEEVSHSHRRTRDTTKKEEAEMPSKNIMQHLQEIEDEFDGLETELSQKDEEIKKLTADYIECKNKSKENEQCTLDLQNEIERFKPLLKQHEAHAQKSANALEKARLLCELLQTDAEIKDLIISQLNSDVHFLKSQLKEKPHSNKESKVENVEIPLTYQAGNYENEQVVKESSYNFEVAVPVESEKGDFSKGKDEQSARLREQIMHMATVMERVKEHNERVIAEKNKEIEKQERTIAMIKELYHSLKNETKREEILSDIQLLVPEKETNDAAFIIEDFKNQLKSMKDEINNKTETIKGLKKNIREIKRDDDEIDRSMLSRKENIHKVLSIQLEEKEKKLTRMEKLLEGLKEIYNGKVPKESDYDPSSEEEVSSRESGEVKDTALLSEDSIETSDGEGKPQSAKEKNKEDSNSDEIVPSVINKEESGRDLQAEKEIVSEDVKVYECFQDQLLRDVAGNVDQDLKPMIHLKDEEDNKGGNIDIPLVEVAREQCLKTADQTLTGKQIDIQREITPTSIKSSSSKAIDAKDFPSSGWKVKLLAYILIGIGLSFLPQYLETNTLRVVLAGVATPLFFLLSAIEVKAYRKKAESYLKSQGMGANSTPEAKTEDDEINYLLNEERKLKMESDQKLIQGLQEQLQQEIEAQVVKVAESKGRDDEVDVLKEQKREVDHLQRMLHTLEKTKIEEQEQNKMNFDEYIKLRSAVEELKRKRDLESSSKMDLANLVKLSTAKLDSDLTAFSIRPRSLPLWVGLALGLYHVTALHPAAPCGIFVLITLYAVNSWYKIKNFKNKLLEERETNQCQSEELEDLTKLLQKEHEVVETQKDAIDIMVREIDNEYVSRKGKAVILAKMILQMRELEEMRYALKEENIEQGEDSGFNVAMLNISKENAAERVRLFFEMSRKLPELEEESLDDLKAIENLNDTVTFAETRLNETGIRSKATPTPAPLEKTSSLLQKLIPVTMVTLSTAALVASMIFKSYIPAALVAIQLVIYLLSQKQSRKNGHQSSNPEELKTKLEQEVKKNKANRLQIGKLKRLLATEKSLKRSEDCAKEIRLRVKERADKRKLVAGAFTN